MSAGKLSRLAALALLLVTLPMRSGRAADPVSAADDATADSTGAGVAHEDTAAHSTPAAPNTGVRAFGTPFRFGGSVATAQRHGDFPIAKIAGKRGEVARAGDGSWLGIEGRLELFFLRGELQRVRFTADQPSPRERDYAQDQLRSAGFRRRCDRTSELAQTCTWTGRCKVTLETGRERLVATLEPPPAASPVVAATAPLVPERFVIGRPGASSRLPAPRVVANPPPEYDRARVPADLQANVWVRALVSEAGAVESATVTRSVPVFDSIAIATARRWRFEPYRWNGRAARIEVEFPIRFLRNP